uniref:Dachshund family transcription factor 1 n=1 Tax=Chelonoidis abingdonii TaxID=106734 RepID=A0A8C0GSA6_CHEAB
MAVPAALIPPTQLVPPPPPISTSAACTTTTTTSSATSSPSPSIAPPPASSGTNLFRPEPIAAAAAAAAATVTSTTSSGGGSSSSSNGGGGGNNCSPSLGTSSSNSAGGGGTSTPSASTANSSSLPGKPVYSTPSPVENTPQNNECKMVDLRGAKVASFTVEGCELICLPQAFDLFLKHLVGGLHTVYTKLKRLEITPVVCNVEQVRILRGLGAIQPGVNRCKLISRKDFETLYNDCTNASSRPGRPPKRTQSVTSPENSHIMPHSVPGLMSPGIIPPTGLTAAAAAAAAATNAAIAEAMKVKKIKLEAMSNYHASNNQHGAESENGDLNSSVDETPLSTPTARDSLDKLSLTGHGQPLPPGFPSPFLFPDGLSSIETLLTNIQGLLKVAIDNARAQEKQVQLEKTELKMELFRERELRETLEKQLAVEQKNRAIIQKRLKKEKKAKRKLQEALEFETKRREQAEQTLKQATSTDSLRALNDSLTPEIEADRSGGRTDAERTIQGRHLQKAINLDLTI